MKVAQYPRNADGTPMDLMVGVVTDAKGNSGARLVTPPVGPDNAPIDAVGIILATPDGNPIDLSSPNSLKSSGAIGDGVANDTAGINAAASVYTDLYASPGTYLASAIALPANVSFRTSGLSTKVKQLSGTVANTRLLNVNGSNVGIGPISVEGQLNQAGDTTDEQNHGIFMYVGAVDTSSRAGLTVGDVNGTNVRGDVLTTGVHPTAYAAGYRLSGVTVGRVVGSNVYRNVVSLTGGSNISIASITGTSVGYNHLDIEPDVGSGPVTGVRVGYIKGRFVSLVGPTAADYVDGVSIEHIDLSPTFSGTSAPAYGTTLTHGMEIRNLKYVRIEKATITGFDGAAIKQIFNGGELTKQTLNFGELDISNCSLADAANYGYVTGTPGVTRLQVDSLRATISDPKAALLNCDWSFIKSAELVNNTTSGAIRACANNLVCNFNHTGTGTPFLQTDYLVAINGRVAATAATLSSFSTNPLFIGYDVTVTTLFNTCTHARLIHSIINGQFYYDYAAGAYTIDGLGNFNTGGGFLSSSLSAGIGYGAGIQPVQATNKGTAVAANGICGQITMNGASLAANTAVSFTFTNTAIGANDQVAVWIKSGAAGGGTYLVQTDQVAAGSCRISLRNLTGGALAETLVLGFTITKAAIV